MLCNTRYVLVAVCLASATTAAAGTADAQATLSGTIPWIESPPQIEELSGGIAGAMTIAEFRQREPNDGDPASESTTAYLARDAGNLYIAFRCEDRTPGRIRARLARRDAVLQDDEVVVLLDTFHDRRRAYLFAVNPLGIQADAIVAEGDRKSTRLNSSHLG